MRPMLLLFLLAGCATTPKPCPPAIPKLEIQKQVVEVAKPCPVDEPQRPAKLARPLPTDLEALAAVLANQLMLWEAPGGYGDRASAAIRTCKGAGQ